jgi:hypothetical protein
VEIEKKVIHANECTHVNEVNMGFAVEISFGLQVQKKEEKKEIGKLGNWEIGKAVKRSDNCKKK